MLVLFAALIVPRFVDWTAYKQAFEREASRIVGQPVTVAGDANLRLLPLPGFSFTELSVGRYDDGTAMMTVDRFSLTTELLPFLRGEMRIVEMRVESPQVTVQVNENGTVDWTSRNNMVVDPDNVHVERMQIENATIQVDGLAGGRTIRGEQFSAAVSAQSLYGPWRIEAEGEIDGSPTMMRIATGRLQPDGSIGVRTTVSRPATPYRLHIDGPLSVEDQLLKWTGSFEVTPMEIGGSADAPPLPIRAEGLFEAGTDNVQVSEYRLEIGEPEDPYTITGSGAASIREAVRFSMTAAGRQIDLDRLQPEETSDEPAGLDRRLGALKSVVDRIPIPRGEGEIVFTLPAVVAGDTVIREVSAVVHPDINGWRFDTLRAILPGNTDVAARGKLGIGDDFGFTGEMELWSEQPTGFANWLSGRNNASLRRLRSAGFSGYVTVTGSQATFDNLRLELDGAVLTGRLQRIPPVNGRGAIIADLSGSVINIDDLQAIYALTQNDEDKSSLTSHDLDIKLNAGELSGAGLNARDVVAQIRIEKGSISIDKFDADDFYGSTIRSYGKLTDMLGQPSGDFGLTVKAEDGSGLTELGLRTLGENRILSNWQSDPELTNDVNLEFKLDARPEGDVSQGRLSVSGTVGGTSINIRDSFRGNPKTWRKASHDLSVRLRQDDPLILARQLSLPIEYAEPPGPMSVSVELSGDGGKGMAANFAVNAPGTDLTASGVVDLAADPTGLAGKLPETAFDLQVTLGSQDMDEWLILAGMPLGTSADRIPVSFSARTRKEGGRYSLSGISGQYGGVGFDGNVMIDAGRAGRPKATGSINLDRLSLPALGEVILGGGSLAFAGEDAAAIPFNEPDIRGIDMDLGLTSDDLGLGENHDAANLDARVVVLDRTFSSPSFSFDWLGGQFSGNASVKNVGGNVFLNTQLRGSKLDMEQIPIIAEYGRVATGTAGFNATLDANGADLPELLSSLSGSGVLSGSDIRIHGISTGGFDRILREIDAEEFEIKPENVRAAAKKAMLGGSFAVKEFSAPFTVTGGEAVIRNLTATDNDGEVGFSIAYSIDEGTHSTEISVAPYAGKNALEAARPEAIFTWTGEPGSIELSVDANALESYVSLRAFEREQKRVAIMQSNILEKQRLRREVTTTLDRIAYRERQRAEELRRMEELQRRLERERQVDDGAESDAGPDDAQTRDDAPVQLQGEDAAAVEEGSEPRPGQSPVGAEETAIADETSSTEQTEGLGPIPLPSVTRSQTVRRGAERPREESSRPNTFMEALERLFGN